MWPAVIALLILIAFALGFYAGRSIPSLQNLGEAMVAKTINRGLNQPFVLLNNVTFPQGEASSQIDHILVTDKAIFVIETKHYSGWIFGDPRREQWTQVIYRKKTKFHNPAWQNYGHVKVLQSLFTLPADAFVSLVVFTGDAEFKTDLGPEVIKLDQLLERVNSARPSRFDERQMAYIVGRIEMKRLRRSIETDEYHIERIQRRAKAFGS